MTSASTCIAGEKICVNGTAVTVNVNDTISYRFYVINDDGNELTLIMDRNLGEKVAWITKEDYEAAGGFWNMSYGSNDKGPITVLKRLENLTKDWSNIEAYNYEVIDDSANKRYSSLKRTNVRARLLTKTELIKLGCNENNTNACPQYLSKNLSASDTNEQPKGYWTTTTWKNESSYVFYVSYNGYLYGNNVMNTTGIRPVIKIPKNI